MSEPRNDRQPPEFWENRISVVTQDMLASAEHEAGAKDAEALRQYLGWLRKKWLKVAPD